MTTVKEAASAFLANDRIAVTGVSRTPGGHGSNAIFKRLRDRGYEVFAVNPNADEVEGDHCFHHLRDIPGGVDAVVIATSPAHAEETMQECVELGVHHAWMHRSFGEGRVCDEATVYGREHGMTVIDGGCPLMFAPTADFAHKVMRVIFSAKGKVPKTV
jgi:predicted CoA-binding protein